MRQSIEIGQNVKLDTLECGGCGTPFAMSSNLRAQRYRDHELFYCPNGHARHYPQESREELAERLLILDKGKIVYQNMRQVLDLAGLKEAYQHSTGVNA